MNQAAYVADDEIVYRRIPNSGPTPCYRMENGSLKVSSTAFNDQGMMPSLDRAILRSTPSETQQYPSDGVISMITSTIRGIKTIGLGKDENGEPTYYQVDVVARPIPKDNPENEPENLAHAQIEPEPGFQNPTRFKKLKEALALLATSQGKWEIAPSE